MQSKVMVASSYPVIVEGIKAMLEECKDVTVVYSTISCKDVASELVGLNPDIAILDVQLSDGCSFDVIKDCAGKNLATRFLFLSCLDDKKHFEKAIGIGAHSLLLKSVTKDELITAVRAAIANEIYVQPKLATALFGPKGSDNGGVKILPPRQQQILEFMADGFSNKEIASQLGLSIETVNTHVKQIFKNLEAKGRAQAVAIAFRRSLIK